MTYRRKKIWLDERHSRFVWCFVYRDLNALNAECVRRHPHRKHRRAAGVHYPCTIVKYPEGKVTPQTGDVLLALGRCAASTVAHEFAHAVIWRWMHARRKR